MRFHRNLSFGLGALMAAVLVVLLLVPFVFRDRIATRLKTEVNESVNARVDWRGAHLSVLRDFPNATLDLDRLSVVGTGPFQRDTLVSVRQARLVLDIGSVIGHVKSGRRIVVREMVLTKPSATLRVLADGRANWDIARASTGAARDTARSVAITLRDFRIADGRVTLEDERSHVSASLTGLHESLRGDFARDRVMLATRTRIDTASFRFADVPYLTRVRVEFNADVNADLRARRFTFANDSLRLNDLVLAFAGSVTMGDPNVALDLTFATPSTAFRDLLSLVPAVYARDFNRLQTSGTMSTSGRVRGAYGPAAFPALALRARVTNGAFHDPRLPLPARDIVLDLAIDNPGGHVDSTIVDLKRLHAVIGGRPLDARFTMRTPVSDPQVDLRVVGALNLADIARTVKLEGVSELAGLVSADIGMRARMSDLDAGRYDQVAAGGTINIARLAIRSSALPHAIAIDTAALRLAPRAAELTSFSARIGASDVRAVGSLHNVLGFALRNEDLRGSATVASTHIDLNEWRSKEKMTEVIPVPAHADFSLETTAARVTYGAITAANVRGALRVKDQRVTLDGLRMETLRGSVVANGFYETTVPTRPTFDIDFRLAGIDIPSAFAALTTVQKFVPLARWAQGGVSGTVGMKGVLGSDMTPVFPSLTGKGAIETERLIVQGAPVFEKLADVTRLDQLRKPSLGIVKASFDVADGRLHVKPFVVNANGVDMTVAGSNGIDQSIKYDLALALPRTALGLAAGSAAAKLAGDVIHMGARVAGTVTHPEVSANSSGVANTLKQAAQSAVQHEIDTRTATVKQKVDSAADEARQRARAEGERLVAEAERQATKIRADARTLATAARREGNERADSLRARSSGALGTIAAQAASERLRRESEQRADQIVREADARADALVAGAKRQTESVLPARG